MSKFRKALLGAALIALPATALAEPLGLGRPALPEEVAAWDIDVRPDGTGLPVGSGDVSTGEALFEENCAVCHGVFGEGVDRWPILAGGEDTLAEENPEKTVGSYWPYLSTVYDYVNRAMPFGNARSLSNDDVYAITAYILYLNFIVDDDFTLSNENFLDVEMPNAQGFFFDDRETAEIPLFTHEPCMTDCSAPVSISAHAQVLDVTPEDAAAAERRRAAREGGEVAAAGEAPAEAPQPEAAPQPEEPALDPALVEAGARVFRRCQACHQVGDTARNTVGPHLNGIVGRTAGTVEDFRYSPALTEAGAGGLTWDAQSLAAYLENPRGYLPGNRMAFPGLPGEEDRDALIAYLTSMSR